MVAVSWYNIASWLTSDDVRTKCVDQVYQDGHNLLSRSMKQEFGGVWQERLIKLQSSPNDLSQFSLMLRWSVISRNVPKFLWGNLFGQSQSHLPSRVQSPGPFKPYNSAFCLVIMRLATTSTKDKCCCSTLPWLLYHDITLPPGSQVTMCERNVWTRCGPRWAQSFKSEYETRVWRRVARKIKKVTKLTKRSESI